MKIKHDEITKAMKAGDRERLGTALLALAGVVVGEYTGSWWQWDKWDSDDLQAELAAYAWTKLQVLRKPDRAFTYTYTVMCRRICTIIRRATKKTECHEKYAAMVSSEIGQDTDAMDTAEPL